MEVDSAIEKMTQQNDKLKNELTELTVAFDEAMKRHKAQTLKKARVPIQEEMRGNQKEQELRRIYTRINKYKTQIESMKSYIDGNLHGTDITDLENEERFLKNEIAALQKDHDGHVKVAVEQANAINQVENSQGYPAKMKELNDELLNVKNQYRTLLSKQAEDEKVLKEHHRRVAQIEDKNRQMKMRLKESQKRPQFDADEPRLPSINESDISEIKRKIAAEESAKRQEIDQLKRKIADAKSSLSAHKGKIETLDIQLKEKDQECRLNDLKINQMKRISRYGHIEAMRRSKAPPEPNSRSSKPMLTSSGDDLDF